MAFIADLARVGGHEVFFLSCDADVKHCYTKQARPAVPNFLECAACQLSGVKSFESKGVNAIGSMLRVTEISHATALEWSSSSAATLGRFETVEEFSSEEFKELASKMAPAVAKTFSAAVDWIIREHLEVVVVFNGRIDITRAVIEAAKFLGVPFLTFERAMFGDGIQILPGENCIGLVLTHNFVRDWIDKPLRRDQTRRALYLASSRLAGTGQTEWRTYNRDAEDSLWPLKGKRRVLILPSSWNETYGHPDWSSDWVDPREAFSAAIQALNLARDEVLVRFHPGWAQKINSVPGAKIESAYQDWVDVQNLPHFGSKSKASTVQLIEQADLVIVWSSSGAIDSALLGKPVLRMGPASYAEAGISVDGSSPSNLAAEASRLLADWGGQARYADNRRRMALRFLYIVANRIPQFADFVKASDSHRFWFRKGADPRRLSRILETQVVLPDDGRFGLDESWEDKAVTDLARGRLVKDRTAMDEGNTAGPRRRFLYALFNYFREKLKPADAWF